MNAIYPGSFDPITYGHLDIIGRASKLYDKLYIGISKDETIKGKLFSTKERVALTKEAVKDFDNIEVLSFDGLLVEFCNKIDCKVIIRGLRALSDYEYEFKMALMNRALNDQIVTLFMMPHERYTHISSSLIREVSSLGGDISSYVPKTVSNALREKFE
tara:strand:- start:3572 stop:4048 length:477 start_codon:yes stop_codon:yes gene_type:complete